jgi:hypothetical protein
VTHLLYDLSVALMQRSLQNLDAIVTKADAYVTADAGIDQATMIQARLYPNMRPFVFQIRSATDTAKNTAARLTGREAPSWADDETTFAEVHARLAKGIDYLSGFKPQDFDGAENRAIELKLGGRTVPFTGATYLSNFALPNFFFHVTTAYNILRHNGVAIGKRDFLGPS